MIYYIAGLLLIFAAIFALTAGLGLLRLPDLYTRMHAASKAGTLGSGLALCAIAIVSDDMSVTLRAIAGIVFFLLTAPISAHLLARAALISKDNPILGEVEEDVISKIK